MKCPVADFTAPLAMDGFNYIFMMDAQKCCIFFKGLFTLLYLSSKLSNKQGQVKSIASVESSVRLEVAKVRAMFTAFSFANSSWREWMLCSA